MTGLPVGDRRAVFLDRDGVLVIPELRGGRSYAPRDLASYRFYPEAAEALKQLRAAGYLLVVVTNQPDVGNGLVTQEIVDEMHRRLMTELPVDAIKVCPHTREDGCACRKPKPGMLLEAAEELGISLPGSFIVGDRAGDVEAGRLAGCRTVFVDLDYDEPKPDRPDFTVGSVAEAAQAILGVKQMGETYAAS